jgi:vacuolar-type H+-ATPase subunit F/Vma7
VGLVAINDRFLGGLGASLTRKIERSSLPVVVPFPDPRRRGEGHIEEYLAALLSRSIGYRIRLRT